MVKNVTETLLISKSPHIILRAKKVKSGWSLYLDIHYNKKRIYEFLSLYLTTDDKRKMTAIDRETLRLAETIKSKRLIEINEGSYKVKSYIDKETDFIEYLDDFTENQKNTSGYYRFRSCLKQFKKFTPGVNFAGVNVKFIESFKGFLIENLSEYSGHDILSCLNRVLNQAVRDKIIEKNPFDEVSNIKINGSLRTFLTIEEISVLNNTPCKYEAVKNAFLFSCFTGLRLGDCISLTWNQIQSEGDKMYLYIRVSKNKKPERLLIAKQARKYLPPGDPIFPLPGDHAIAYALTKWMKAAGINKTITFHSGRHTFATIALNLGVDIKTVSVMLGHSDVTTTQIYAKIIDKTKDEAINRLPEF